MFFTWWSSRSTFSCFLSGEATSRQIFYWVCRSRHGRQFQQKNTERKPFRTEKITKNYENDERETFSSRSSRSSFYCKLTLFSGAICGWFRWKCEFRESVQIRVCGEAGTTIPISDIAKKISSEAQKSINVDRNDLSISELESSFFAISLIGIVERVSRRNLTWKDSRNSYFK